MVSKNICVIALWTKVALSSIGRVRQGSDSPSHIYTNSTLLIEGLILYSIQFYYIMELR